MIKNRNTTVEAPAFPYRWHLKDAVFTKDKGSVYSTFACGGGSTMDYQFTNGDAQYIIGMSVPPVMVARVATEIYQQWLSKINK